MKQLTSAAQVKSWRSSSLGFVPTMGALHPGHLSLVQRAQAECQQVLVSIFVNPTQFNDPKDLAHYPRPLKEDLELLQQAGVDAVFLPQKEEIYADDYRFQLTEKSASSILCGAKRPRHFDGVLTVVMKLFQIVQPEKAYFGEKDYQQLRLIQDMARAFFLRTEIVPCPTMREPDGLAMSSRNRLLTPEQREKAPLLFKALHTGSAREILQEAGFRVDYIEEHWGRRFGAAFLGNVRLIDNVEI